MNKFTKFIKNTIYLTLGLGNPRQLMAAGALVGGLFSSLVSASMPIALADSVVNSGSVFLTVQPITMDEKDNEDMILQNDVFFTANSRAWAVPAISAPVSKTSVRTVIVTAYSSTPDQTDDSPFITANGAYVRDGIVAANFLPFGTKVKFPEYSGDKIYTVEDRMAKKNSRKIDIWMSSRSEAINFGVKNLAYEVVE